MNKIKNLFDLEYVNSLFAEKVLPLYADYSRIRVTNVYFHKKHIWEKTYHVVAEFKTILDGKDEVRIFASAHSSEPRENVHVALDFLWNRGFSDDRSVPKPLFYDRELRAVFYQGLEGKNLYHYIKNQDRDKIRELIPAIASWFVKLHSIYDSEMENFNPHSSSLRTVVPGYDNVLKAIRFQYPHHHDFYQTVYKIFLAREDKFFSENQSRFLIHGDAHPENVINLEKGGIGVIDFTDLCLADFARDLGCFMQQLGYMLKRKLEDAPADEYIKEMQDLFLASYFEVSSQELNDDLRERIDNYYNWTAIRTATYLLMRDEPQQERAKVLIEEVKNKLNI